jgi:hypothetical protein
VAFAKVLGEEAPYWPAETAHKLIQIRRCAANIAAYLD